MAKLRNTCALEIAPEAQAMQGTQDICVKEALKWSLDWIALSFLLSGLFWRAVKDASAPRRWPTPGRRNF
jgi:hypothetical protein